jgi:2-oxoglutarate ferredoxin oxidoreductase subunit alpha
VYRPDRGRVLTAEELEEIGTFYRYIGEGEEHVAARTLPGVHSKGAYFTRGSGHNIFGAYTETPREYQEVLDRLALKHQAAARHVPGPVIQWRERASIGVITVGSGELAVREALDQLAQPEDGAEPVIADVMRVRGFPFGDEVGAFLDGHELCFVVEQNRDGQLRSLLTLETGRPPSKVRSILAYGGFPLSAVNVTDGILSQLGR